MSPPIECEGCGQPGTLMCDWCAKVKADIRQVVEAHESLALDSKADREKLIRALLNVVVR